MASIQSLKERRSEVVAELGKIAKNRTEEARGFSDDERKRISELRAEDDKLASEIKAREEDIGLLREIEERETSLNATNGRRTTATNPGEDKLADDKKLFKSFGEQMLSVVSAARPDRKVDPRLETLSASGMGENVPSDGGFLVQRDFSAQLLRRVYEYGQITSRCRSMQISPNSNGIKINAVDETSRVNGSRWGGVQVFWGNEADTPTAKKPKLRQMELDLKKLIGLCYATDELLADAVALESVLMQAFSEEMSFSIEDCIINGVGGGQMLGILNSGALVSVAKETGQQSGTVVKENIDKMWSRCWGRSRQDAVWLINQDVEPQLYSLNQVVGTGGLPVYLPPGGLSQSPLATLYGRPVIPVEYCATVGTVGDIILADFSQYLTIDKGQMQAASSVHVRFIYDESTFRFVYRTDGQPIWNSALTPKNGTNTLSPFVALSSR